MTASVRYPPQQGYAWREGWQERLRSLIRERGFGSVADYVESQPGTPLVALAEELGTGDVAAVQIQWRWVAEAEADGTLERCARSLLARALREQLPEGWQQEWKDVPGEPTPLARKAGAFADLITAMPEAYRETARRVCVALNATDISQGWLPANADDPVLLDIFRRHWHT